MSYLKPPKAPISLILKREREERSLEQSQKYEQRLYLQQDYPPHTTKRKKKPKQRGCVKVDFTI